MPASTKKGSAAKKARPTTVAEYIAGAPADKRAALVRIRKAIKAADPEAVEALAYGLVGYKHHGRPLVSLGYWKEHIALYGSNVAMRDAIPELRNYEMTKGTIRFSADRAMPDVLVRKIVRARIAEIDRAN